VIDGGAAAPLTQAEPGPVEATPRADRVTIIAEAGVNHNGSLDLALALVDAASDAGADIVKFQTFVADRLASRAAPKADYQLATTDAAESQHAMLRRLELTEAMHVRLIERCAQRGIEFLSTPFDEHSLDLLVGFGVKRLKIPSGEITNGPLLLKAARTGLPIILSTGMSELDEVEAALGVLAFGYAESRKAAPSDAAFHRALASAAGREAVAANVTLLHCTTEYPAPLESVNLRAMDTMSAAFGTKVGYSDHTPGIAVAIAAAARGACVIEKHVTLDRSLPGPDHRASIEPHDFTLLVESVRAASAALGRPDKTTAPCERTNRSACVRA
jgi:N-acetylneuraminate synthase